MYLVCRLLLEKKKIKYLRCYHVLSVISHMHSFFFNDPPTTRFYALSLHDALPISLVGTGLRGNGPDGDPRQCAMARPHGVCLHQGSIIVSDSENHRLRILD